jgi:hypothetical protein
MKHVSGLEGLGEDDGYGEGRTRPSTNTVLLVGGRIKESLCGGAVLLGMRKVFMISGARNCSGKEGV